MGHRLLEATVVSYNAALSKSPWQSALALADEVDKTCGSMTLVTYNSIISLAEWGRALNLLEDLQLEGFQADLISFNAAIDSTSQSSRWRRTISLLCMLSDQKMKADEVSFSSAMGGSWSRAMQLMSEALDQQRCNMVVAHAAIGLCPHWKDARDILHHFVARGLELTSRSFNVLHSLCAVSSAWTFQHALLDQQRSQSTEVDLLAMNSVLAAHESWCKSFQLLKSVSLSLQLDVITHSSCISEEWARNLHILEKLQAGTIQGDITLYNALANGCQEAWMHASCLLAGLYRWTLRMDRITFNEAAAAAAMGGWCCAMTELGNAMDRGFYMSTDSLNVILSSLQTAQKWQQSLEFFSTGDGISFNTLLGTILFDTKRWRYGLAVLRAAADIDVFPQGRNALVTACEMQDVTVVEGVVSSGHREVMHFVLNILCSGMRYGQISGRASHHKNFFEHEQLCNRKSGHQPTIPAPTRAIGPEAPNLFGSGNFMSKHVAEIAEGLQSLDEEVRRAFDSIQKQLASLQKISGGEVEDVDHETEIWHLSHEDVAATGGELILSEEALILGSAESGDGLRLNTRLNSHMLELSQKAGEAVDAVGKENWKRETGRRSNFDVTESELENWQKTGCSSGCRVIPPNSRFRMGWDIFGMGMMVCDAFLLPFCIAWQLNLTPFPETSEERGILQVFAVVSLTFWPTDIVLNFCTAFHLKGHLIVDRISIALHYMKTWFFFDIIVVMIDFISSFMTSVSGESNDILQPLRSARYLRALRTLRILRILKAGKINTMMENLVISMGRQWLILAFTVGKMLVTIGMVTHILCCAWYGLGKYITDTGERSWLDLAQVPPNDLGLQYAHAATWILLPPAPPLVEPESRWERFAALMCFVTTVLVIGSALSILTGTLNEIRQVNNERSKKRRELRIFLQTRKIPTELTMRIMSYADYKMTRHSPVSYDSDLISPMLEAELSTVMFGSILTDHPFFLCTSTIFPSVFAELCRTVEKKYFCEAEYVFSEGALAEMMYITSHGHFALVEDNRSRTHSNTRFVDEKRYFSEVALYAEAVVHHFALRTDSFAEVFVLTASRLAQVLSNSPMCATMFIEYATEFVSHYKPPLQGQASFVEDLAALDMSCAKMACENNSFYLELNVDSRKVIKTLDLTYLQDGPSPAQEEESSDGISDVYERSRITLSEFLQGVVYGEASMAQTQLRLRDAYVELDMQEGLHARYSDHMEQERAESGILSLIALVRQDYEGYTSPQGAGNRLTKVQFDDLQEVLRWAQPDNDRLAGSIFLLAIKGLGKFRCLTRQMPLDQQRPEQALLYILMNYKDAVPSLQELSNEAKESVKGILELQKSFNFAQMLQGENVPASVHHLRQTISEHGGLGLVQFYVIYLLGFMSGLAGGQGSRFMNCRNAAAVLWGFQLMKNVLLEDPAASYWTYIRHRSLELGHEVHGSADLALARLA
eukprot:symbB.v1.2.013694.t1/scaffold974.1/size359025/1